MIVLIHMMAGLPAHVHKLLAAQQCNMELLQNHFIAKSCMMLLLAYHKKEQS
jgi:hypothetical protein